MTPTKLPTKKERESVLYIRGLPADVKAQFKAWCARRSISMTKAIEDLMRKALSNPTTGNTSDELHRRVKG